MYLAPWQIFVMGSICGITASVIVILMIIIRMAIVSGVRVEREEEEENGKSV